MKNDFYIGYELECLIDKRDCKNETKLRTILRRIHPDIALHVEGSINDDDLPKHVYDSYDNNYNTYPTEIVTPPLKVEHSLRVLKRVFRLISSIGYTNYSCGLHVNISPVNKCLFDKMNYIYLAFHPLFKEIAEKFDRDENDFSRPNEMPDDFWLDILYACNGDGDGVNVYREKEAAINLDYVSSNNGSERRIEIRAFGNENYHRKLGDIKKYINKIIVVLRKSVEYQFDYLK